jgi:SAM-dependent methyltransferase
MNEVSQETFRSVYRNRDGFLHRSSYVRLGKSYAVHAALADAGVELSGKRIYDFGFGPGSFLLSCPVDCRLAGCEIDVVNVERLTTELRRKGHPEVDLRTVSEDSSEYRVAFGGGRFDVIVMSHVLEHIAEPEQVLIAAREALTDDGVIVVVLPLNERRPDPRHFHDVTVDIACDWFRLASLDVAVCRTLGCLNYLIQPYLKGEKGVGRFMAQAIGLTMGLASRLFSPVAWWAVTDRLLPWKRGQVVLVGRVGHGDQSDSGSAGP